jgi:hypothetical protein
VLKPLLKATTCLSVRDNARIKRSLHSVAHTFLYGKSRMFNRMFDIKPYEAYIKINVSRLLPNKTSDCKVIVKMTWDLNYPYALRFGIRTYNCGWSVQSGERAARGR